ncbi:MFS transporter [Arthrobacter sp. SO3]|uniref:MFS transporter n=1 Tax=Arthrobacter sp. SO3 TaxID=1897057 RepID=UPI001CFF5A7E|nr:aromatic acid/H+ symport family MFS transporter [Arthrobacter sp. SO3]MCB5294751.1 Gentisate transporter [Arthrobacter sp. SO3]
MNHTPSAATPQRSEPGAPVPIAAGSLPVTAATVGGPAARFSKASAAAVLVCWLLVVFDGYDLIVYGTVQSSLINDTGWGLTKATAGTIGSMAFAGMMIGAIFAGRMADSWGRRRTILGCAVIFSIFTILCAFAPSAAVFGVLRLLAGIGLGGLVPSANALVAELVPAKWRSTIATLMMSGVPIGGSIAALVGIQLIPAYGWQAMFLVAVLALVIVVPLGLKYLPETLAPVSATDSEDEKTTGKAARIAGRSASTIREPSGFSSLLRAPYLGISVLFALATIATLFAWYGLGTWLPNLMQLAGYNLGSALTFALALNLGAVAGSVITAWAGTRFGPVPTAIAAAAVAAGALVVLVTGPSVTVVYLMLVLAGVGTHGTQCLIIAAVASHYPGHLRGTALGWALGTGRIGAVAAPQVGGLLLAAGLGVNSNFLAFAGAAAIAAVLLAAVGIKLKSKLSITPTGASNV